MVPDRSATASFPSDWRVLRVGDVANVKGGKRLPAGTALIPTRTTHPYVRIVDFKDGRVDKSALHYVPDEVFPRIARYTISSKDIYISIVGTIGLVGVIDGELDGANLTENAAKICDIAAHVDKDYLAAFLRSEWGQHQIRALTVGSTQPKLALFRIADISVPVPSLPEQRAIAHILGTLDDKIELNRRMNETLEAMARALFKSWFVDFDPVRAKAEGRDPGLPQPLSDLFPDSFEDSELGEIPKGWDVGTLADLSTLNPESWSKETRPTLINYVDLSNTKWGRIESVTTYAQGDAPSRAQRVLRPGDTIVGTVRPGNGSYAVVSDDGLTGSTGFAVLRPTNTACAEFVNLAATAAKNIEALSHFADGGAYPAVRPEVVAATPIIRPRNEVLVAFSRVAGPLLGKYAGNDRESRTLAALRDTLLPKLISGELRVKDAERLVEGTVS